jgi:DNA-binding transcriptional LysR family regulator
MFRQVVSAGSLAAAAEKMDMSTSAASRLIGLLESEVRLTLFSRTRRRLVLTAQGERLYREAEHILAGFDEIPRIVADIRSRAPSQLRIVTGPRIGQGLVSPALARFRKRHPSVRVAVDLESRFDIEGQHGEKALRHRHRLAACIASTSGNRKPSSFSRARRGHLAG